MFEYIGWAMLLFIPLLLAVSLLLKKNGFGSRLIAAIGITAGLLVVLFPVLMFHLGFAGMMLVTLILFGGLIAAVQFKSDWFFMEPQMEVIAGVDIPAHETWLMASDQTAHDAAEAEQQPHDADEAAGPMEAVEEPVSDGAEEAIPAIAVEDSRTITASAADEAAEEAAGQEPEIEAVTPEEAQEIDAASEGVQAFEAAETAAAEQAEETQEIPEPEAEQEEAVQDTEEAEAEAAAEEAEVVEAVEMEPAPDDILIETEETPPVPDEEPETLPEIAEPAAVDERPAEEQPEVEKIEIEAEEYGITGELEETVEAEEIPAAAEYIDLETEIQEIALEPDAAVALNSSMLGAAEDAVIAEGPAETSPASGTDDLSALIENAFEAKMMGEIETAADRFFTALRLSDASYLIYLLGTEAAHLYSQIGRHERAIETLQWMLPRLTVPEESRLILDELAHVSSMAQILAEAGLSGTPAAQVPRLIRMKAEQAAKDNSRLLEGAGG